MSNRVKILVKVCVTFALLGVLVYRMDLSEFRTIFLSARWSFVLVAGLLHLSLVPLSTARWGSILENFDIHTPFLKLGQICLIGYFFNMFLPSAIGGDVFRAYYLSRRESKGISTTLTSTALDRLAGFVGMLVIALVATLLFPIRIQGFDLLLFLLLLVAAFVVGVMVLFNDHLHLLLIRLLDRFGLVGLEHRFEAVYRGLNQLRKNLRTIAFVVLVSVVIQFLVIVAMWLAARSIGIEAPFYFFLVFIPMVNLSIAIPLTINGMGLRETMYYLLFSQVGVPVETAVTLSILNLVVVAMTALPGGVVYALYKKDSGFPAPDLALDESQDQKA